MANLYRSKKGIAFFAMLPLIMILVLTTFWLVYKGPSEKAIFDSSNIIINDYSKKEFYFEIERPYIETYVKNFLQESKSKYLSYSVNQNQQKIVTTLPNYDVDNNVGCTYGNKNLIYNEKSLKEFKKSKSIDSISCLNVDKDFELEYSQYVKTMLEANLEDFLSERGISLNVEVSATNNELVAHIITESTSSSKYSSGKSNNLVSNSAFKKEYTIHEDLKLYPNLLKSLNTDVFPSLGDEIKKNVLICKKDDSIPKEYKDKELYCIQKIFTSLIPLELSNSYNFELTRIEDSEDVSGDYYGLNLEVTDKITNQLVLSQGILLENTIPFGLVQYELGKIDNADNLITLEIEKPKQFNPVNYIIVYSNENFIDDANLFDKFQSALENSNIPKDSYFQRAEFLVGGDSYYYSKDNNLPLDIIVTDNNNFDSTDKKKVLIYQKYNSVSHNYELLKENDVLFFVIFAVDSKYNYYSDEELLKENLKSAKVTTNLGPIPLTKSQVSITGTILGAANAFEFTVSNYEDSKFKNYDLYVTKGKDSNDPLLFACEGIENYECGYITFTPDSANGRFYVSSNNNPDSTEIYDDIVPFNSFKLENDQTYQVTIVPQDLEKRGKLTSQALNFVFESRASSNDGPSYFILNTNGVLRMSVESFGVTIEDNKIPSLNDIDLNSLYISSEDNKIFNFNWETKDATSDIDSVYIKGTYLTSDETQMSFTREIFKELNTFSFFETNILSLTITHIIPKDISGNPSSVEAVNLEEYQLSESISWP